MRVHDIHPSLPAWLHALDDELISLLAGERPLLCQAATAAVGTRGKRIRPTLLFLTCAAFGAVTPRALRYGTLVEVVHAASLAHDDVLDEADLRRGELSLPSRFGNKLSILVGDYLLSRVFELATDDGDLQLLRILTRAATAMTRAVTREISDLTLDADEATYQDVIHGKTAALFGAATQVGSVLGGATPAQQEAARRFGEAFGCAFQVADDLLDLQGAGAAAGKPDGADWQQRRATLPVLRVLATAPPAVAAEVRALWNDEHDGADRLAALRALLELHGGFAYGWEQATALRGEAQRRLAHFPAGDGRAALEALCCDLFPLPLLPVIGEVYV
jgi:octaprenyl-diphosphate synthase